MSDTAVTARINPIGRYELKYLITEQKARRIAEFIGPYCVPDPYLKGKETYVITSLYLDTPGRDMLWAKKTLQSVRMKVRVRTYGINADGPVFLEIKRRFNDVMVKTRVQVPEEHWSEVLRPGPDERFLSWVRRASKFRVIQDFRAQCAVFNLEPVVLVRYNRQPFIGRLEPGVRVTFDRGLRCCRESRPVLRKWDKDYRFIDAPGLFESKDSLVILEMKFDHTYPLWMVELVRLFGLRRESFSKYTTSMDAIRQEVTDFAPLSRTSVLV